MMTKKELISVVLTFYILMLNCSLGEEQQITGGSTGTEVSALVGKIINPDSTPAVNAQIKIRTADFLPDSAMSDSYLNKNFIADNVTNNSGEFKFDSVPPDTYSIEVTQGDTLALSIGINVEHGTPKYDLQEKQLTPMVTISGYVRVDSHSAKGRIQVRGMDKIAYSDNNGHFDIQVPSGKHTFIFDAIPIEDDGVCYKPEIRKFDTRGKQKFIIDDDIYIKPFDMKPPPR